MLEVLGIVVLAVGIGVSIAWHELGHYATARWFDIRVPEFMVGWGRTLFSRRIGETEFGLKVIPIGGYIRMVGMLPPRPGEAHGRTRKSGPFQGLVESVRVESQQLWQPGDETREFWTRAPWQRIVVMSAGPVMNLILAALVVIASLLTIGTPGTMTVSWVEKCMVVAPQPGAHDCPAGAPLTPAARAGLRSGDVVVALAGVRYHDWETFRRAVRTVTGTVPLVVRRDGRELTLLITPVRTTVPRLDGQSGFEQASFLGYEPVADYQSRPLGFALGQLGDYVSGTGVALAKLPGRIPDLVGQVFGHRQRDLDTPLSVVGVSRLGGQVLGQDGPVKGKLLFLLQLLAGVNLSMFLLNLLPVPPFDGGHIMAAAWEAVRRRLAALFGRTDPGPVDLARLMPVAYAVGVLFLGYSALVVLADVINPVRLS